MSAISSLLVRDDIVSVAKIEEALQRQVLEGGDIDTALLELDILPENVLNAYRAASFWLAPVEREALADIPPEVMQRVPRELAERHCILPIAAQGRRLVIAAMQPLSAAVDQQLGFRLGYELEVRIATEVRIRAALARYHGAPLDDRLRRLATQLEARPAGQVPMVQPPTIEELRRQSSWPAMDRERLGTLLSEPPPSFDELPDAGSRGERPPTISGYPPFDVPSRPQDARDRSGGFRHERTLKLGIPKELMQALDDAPAPAQAMVPEDPAPAARAPANEPQQRPAQPNADAQPSSRAPATRHARGGPLRVDVACTLLQSAPNRDTAVEILFSFARQLFDCTLLFVVRDHHAHLHHAAGLPAPDLELAFSLEEASAFSDARNTQLPHVAVLSRTDLDLSLRRRLGREDAQSAAVVPVLLRKRVVMLLYGDRGSETFRLEDIHDLLDLLPHVDEALERAIRNRKQPALPLRSAAPRPAAVDPTRATTQVLPRSDASALDEATLSNAHLSKAQLGKQPPGAGSYSMQGLTADVVSMRPSRSAPDHSAYSVRPSSYSLRPPVMSARPRSRRPGDSQRHDPRREPDGGATVDTEVVRLSRTPSVPASQPPSSDTEWLTAPRVPKPERTPAFQENIGSIEGLVQDLQRCGPEDEGPMVAALLRLGEAALPALVEAFPGPLWFEPYQQYSQLPPGRNISAIARALVAFGEQAVPHLVPLFDMAEPERRYCATLLAGDLVHAGLLEPLLQRVFDVEPQVRRLAIQSLLAFIELPQYAAAMAAIRGIVRSPKESTATRMAAIDALDGARDTDSLDDLIQLLDAPTATLAAAAHRALVSLTGKDFGVDGRHWRVWMDKQG